MRSIILLRVLPAACAAGMFALSCASSGAIAASTSKPLVLDSQNGVSDGQSGLILQTAPLSHQPMVAATPAATPTELPSEESAPPIVVAPYINLPTGGASAPRPVYRPRSSP
jgi:hypothetical protein